MRTDRPLGNSADERLRIARAVRKGRKQRLETERRLNKEQGDAKGMDEIVRLLGDDRTAEPLHERSGQ